MVSRRKHVGIERRTIGYTRVSSAEQATSGFSLEAQQARIAAYCKAMEFGIPEMVTDAGASAKTLQRPGMFEIVERVKRGKIERIVVAKLDRLTRSVRDLLDLVDLAGKHDVSIVSVGETLDFGSAAGRMVASMIAVVAAWERERLAERVQEVAQHKRSQRKVYCGEIFGYRRDGTCLVEEPTEQAALQKAVRMDKAGASFREIGAMLTSLGVRPRRGVAWHASCVRKMLRSRIAMERAS